MSVSEKPLFDLIHADVIQCSNCTKEFVLYSVAIHNDNEFIVRERNDKDLFCPYCGEYTGEHVSFKEWGDAFSKE